MKRRLCPPPTWALVFLLSVALLSLSCGGFPSHPYGYWEGKGTAMEIPMDDGTRRLTRSADFDFWFTVAENGEAMGEVDLHYEAELTVDNLPNVTLPIGGGSVSFAPEVGGTLTDLDPTRRFPLAGYFNNENDELMLEIPTADGDRPSLEFTIRADPGVSAGIAGASIGLSPGDAQVLVRKIEMTPFSPFNGSGVRIEKRPDGPFVVNFEDKGENFAIEWSARQVGGEQRTLELTLAP